MVSTSSTAGIIRFARFRVCSTVLWVFWGNSVDELRGRA